MFWPVLDPNGDLTHKALAERARGIQRSILLLVVFAWLLPCSLTLLAQHFNPDLKLSFWPNLVSFPFTSGLILLSLGGPLWKLRRLRRKLYFHPAPMHPPRRDCTTACNCDLNILEQIALQAVDPAPEPPALFWLVWDGKESPNRIRRS